MSKRNITYSVKVTTSVATLVIHFNCFEDMNSIYTWFEDSNADSVWKTTSGTYIQKRHIMFMERV